MTKIHTIELNLDDDFASSCAYHVDDLATTIKRNIEHAELEQATDRWVLVGLADSLDDACEKAKKLQIILCQKNRRTPKFLPIDDGNLPQLG